MRFVPSRSIPLALVMTLAASSLGADQAQKDFERTLKDKYKGKQVTVIVSGMYAGEFKKDAFGPRYDGVAWQHFHESIPVKGGKTILDQIDDRTFATRGTGIIAGTEVGTNTFPVEKGEALAVTDVTTGCARGVCQLTLYLTTFKLSKVSGLDARKATRSTSSIAGLERFGLGCQFTVHFSEAIAKAGQVEAMTTAIGKYLLPSGEAERVLKEEKNLEIDLGASEEEVMKKLGEPLRTIRVGSQKSLKYTDMTVILKDGKVVDVKLE